MELPPVRGDQTVQDSVVARLKAARVGPGGLEPPFPDRRPNPDQRDLRCAKSQLTSVGDPYAASHTL